MDRVRPLLDTAGTRNLALVTAALQVFAPSRISFETRLVLGKSRAVMESPPLVHTVRHARPFCSERPVGVGSTHSHCRRAVAAVPRRRRRAVLTAAVPPSRRAIPTGRLSR